MNVVVHIQRQGVAQTNGIHLNAPSSFVVGRTAECELRLDSDDVSRQHARVVLGSDSFVVEDLSSNGTALSTGAILRRTRAALPYGGHLEVGPFRLTVAHLAHAPTSLMPAFPAFNVTDELVALRRTIHTELLTNLDFAKIDPTRPDPSLRPRVLTALKRIVQGRDDRVLAHVDRDAFIGELLEEALGLGPLEPLLADPTVTEIMVVDPATIYVERAGRLELTRTRFTDDERVRAVIERIVTPLGRRIDESQPLVDARLPDGSRVNAIIRPLALRGACITIRRFPKRRLTVDDFIRLGSLTPRIARFLERAVRAKRNILISGGTGSGKTTLLNVLSGAIPSTERIITIEDAAELQLHQPHVVSLETKHANMEGKGAFTIRDLVKNALRMRPDRIVVGECRGGEALDMLQAMNTGHDGSLTTIHANSPIEALARLETLVLMAGVDLPSRAIREQIARSIHLVVQQVRLADGSRKITHIAEMDEIDPDGRFEVRPIFEFTQTGVTPDGTVIGDFDATGYLPSFLDEMLARGLVKIGSCSVIDLAMSMLTQKRMTIAFVFATVAISTFVSIQSPRGTLRRAATAYIARMDAKRRAMFLPENATQVAWAQLAGIALALALYGATGLMPCLPVALFVAIVPPILVWRQVTSRRARIDEQAHGFALTLSSSLKATASIGDALKGTNDVTAKPLRDELATVLRQIHIGSTLEESLLVLSARVQSSALDVVVSALLIGRQTGGDLPRILEGTAASLRDLKRLEHFTDKETRSAKQALAISAALTAAMAIGLPFVFEGFLDPLRTTLKGQVYALQMALVYLLALYLGYRITRKSI